MSYATEHIASKLKDARERKGLSQRALTKLTGVPQSHISKIENGAVDLRLSSLVELARVLDLELTLVPRKSVSAVSAIVRSSRQRDGERASASLKEFRKLNERLASLTQEYPAIKEIAQLQRQVKDLSRFPLAAKQLDAVREATKRLRTFEDSTKGLDALRKTLAEIRSMRSAIVHSGIQLEGEGTVRPAYSLEDDDD